MDPQAELLRKSTGEVTVVFEGNLSKKSNSIGLINRCVKRTCSEEIQISFYRQCFPINVS